MFKNQTNRNFLFPLAIIIIGLIISSGIFIYRTQINKKPEITSQNNTPEFNLRPVTLEDKIIGNPEADLIIVEYSDFECPFCKEFHKTIEDIMVEYGRSGKVAWVFRNFPLEKTHKNAKNAAIAAECVFKIGGNEKFWAYSSLIFSSNSNLSLESLSNIASEIEINKEEFNSCLKNPKIIEKIDSDIKEGMLLYENDAKFGTPYSFIITKSGIQTKIIGSYPYTVMKRIIDELI